METTKRPWRVGRDNRIEGSLNSAGGCTIVVGEGEIAREADAALIVRAVNSHDDLLAACERAVAAIDRNWPSLPNVPGLREMLGGIKRGCEGALAKAGE
jgi:hypothetical protein